jgi:hypothetical protein
MLSLSLDLNLKIGETLQQQLENLTDEEQKTAFIKQCGGEKKVLPYLKFNQWWQSISQVWQDKIINLPFGLIEVKEWSSLAQLTQEQLGQWYQGIQEHLETLPQFSNRKILSPKVWVDAISRIIPKPKPVKRFLKLSEPVEEADLNVLLNKKDYDFTDETLQKFTAEVLKTLDGKTIVTEDLFGFLENRGLDPLLILSPRDRSSYLLQQKDEELDSLRFQFNEVQQNLKERDSKVEQLNQQNQQQQEQINQLIERLTKLEQLIPRFSVA